MTTIEDVMHALPTDSWVTVRELAESLGTEKDWTRHRLQRLHRQGWAEKDEGTTPDRECRWRACGGSVGITENLFWMEGQE